MYILWIDPGTTTVWYAVIEKENHSYRIIDYGVIHTTPKIALEQKLIEISQDIWALIEKYTPVRAWVEKLFFNTNITTGISVAHARGVIVHEIARRGIEFYEYTPLQVKKALTGNGAAKKAQLQKEALFLTAIQQIFIGRSVRLLPYSLHHYHCIFSTATSNIQRRQRR